MDGSAQPGEGLRPDRLTEKGKERDLAGASQEIAMQSFHRSRLIVWAERLTLVTLTSLFHHFPVPTVTLVCLLIAVRVGMIRVPPEYRDWR